jgi:hypothetical protein
VKSPTGYDISYPQCGGAYPTNVLFGIVGVNDGIVYSANPCLASELAWAKQQSGQPAALYANTADPGPTLSTHWPTGQSFPQTCDTGNLDSTACSYDYGWNAAANSYADAVAAYTSLNQTPQLNEWWLDLETANSWEQNTANNVSELQGEVAYLQSQAVGLIGFYASSNAWQTITGGTTTFSFLPSWRAGIGSKAKAQSYCGTNGVTGGPIKYEDVPCAVEFRGGGPGLMVRR